MTDFARQRQQMVLQQIEARGVRDRLVLDAMSKVRREAFVPSDVRDMAYRDRPLPIAAGPDDLAALYCCLHGRGAGAKGR